MTKDENKILYNLTYPQKSIVLTEKFFNDPHISTILRFINYKAKS